MALTIEQIRERDRRRRSTASAPASEPAPVIHTDAVVFIGVTEPDYQGDSVWIPVDGTTPLDILIQEA